MATRKEILLKAEKNRQAIFDAIGNEVLDVWAIDNKTNIGDKIIKNHLNTWTHHYSQNAKAWGWKVDSSLPPDR